MKKVIAAVDAINFTENQLVYFNNAARLLGGKLVVVFLENIVGVPFPVATTFSEGAYAYIEENYQNTLAERKEHIREKVKLFDTVCINKNIDASLHKKAGMPLEEMIRESRFADLLMVNNNSTFATLFDTNPPKFVKDVLREVQCPVLVLPSDQKEIQELVFTYNGSFSSMYAIRQFTGLFQNFADKKVTVLCVDEYNTNKVEEEHLLSEYLRYHYTNWEIKLLKGDPSSEIIAYLMQRNNYILTLGAYGRSKVSQFFHHSDAEKILEILNTYVFITHP